MDKVECYRRIITEILLPLTESRYANADVQNEAVFDREHDRYLIVSVGWEDHSRRIYHSLVHLDIINDKVWIQRDGTEDGIGYELEAAGIPKSDIVPAFHPENVRPYTGYGVA
jgi:hypothetical protein